MNTVITRFAPSPTGLFHAGSYRTALFSWIYARQNGGKFILRIEDTDRERSKKEYEDNIIESLKWLGLDYDEMFRQSDRTDVYKKYIQQLIDSGKAYVSDEKDVEEGSLGTSPDISQSEPYRRVSAGSRSEHVGGGATKNNSASNKTVIRFKNPNKKVTFNDLIRGEITFDTTELGDFVIAKSLDEPIFHLVNVVDDYDMGITHVIRGEDHISNTPRQILIYEGLGLTPPIFAHIPLLLAKDKSKLSKRHGAIAMTEYRDRGYLHEAIVNYLALLGWHPADDREMLTLPEITKEFSFDRVQKGGAVFDEEKLKWFNRQYISKLNDEQFLTGVTSFIPKDLEKGRLHRAVTVMRDKVATFGEVKNLFEGSGDLAFLIKENDYDPSLLLWKKNPDKDKAAIHLTYASQALSKIPDADFNIDKIKNTLWDYVEQNGKGDVLWPLRVSLTGQEKSPDPFVSAYILGKQEAVTRINKACELLKA